MPLDTFPTSLKSLSTHSKVVSMLLLNGTIRWKMFLIRLLGYSRMLDSWACCLCTPLACDGGCRLLFIVMEIGSLESGAFYLPLLDVSRAFGFWSKSMSTMALVRSSVLSAYSIVLALGILAAKNPRFKQNLNPSWCENATIAEFCFNWFLPLRSFQSAKPPAVFSDSSICLSLHEIRLTALGHSASESHRIEAMVGILGEPEITVLS